VLAVYIIAGITLFITLVLLIPVDMALDLEAHENVKARMRVGWLFGLVQKDMRQRRKKKPEKKRKKNIKPVLSVLRTKGLPRGLLKLAGQMLSRLKVRQMDAELKVGLDDPADTAMMCSLLWPALVPLSSFGPVRLRIEPVFDEPAFEASLHGKVRLYPIQTVGPVLRFILSATGWRTIRSMVVSRWK